jgi:hypothetical protein
VNPEWLRLTISAAEIEKVTRRSSIYQVSIGQTFRVFSGMISVCLLIVSEIIEGPTTQSPQARTPGLSFYIFEFTFFLLYIS